MYRNMFTAFWDYKVALHLINIIAAVNKLMTGDLQEYINQY